MRIKRGHDLVTKVILYGILINLILQVLQVFDQPRYVFDIKEHVLCQPLLFAQLLYGKLVVPDVVLVAWLTYLLIHVWVKLRELGVVRFLKEMTLELFGV